MVKEKIKHDDELIANIISDGEVFKTQTRVPIDDEVEVQKLSLEAQDIERLLYKEKQKLADVKADIKVLTQRKEQVIQDIIELKHTVEIDAYWKIDTNTMRKHLCGIYEGREIIVESAPVTEFDLQTTILK